MINRKGGNCEALQLEGCSASRTVVLGFHYDAHNVQLVKLQRKV